MIVLFFLQTILSEFFGDALLLGPDLGVSLTAIIATTSYKNEGFS